MLKAEIKTIAYEKIEQEVNATNLPAYGKEPIGRELDIMFEWSLLIESQRIVDELQVMQEVFAQQIVVVKELAKAIKSTRGSKSTLARAAQLVHDIGQRRNELLELEKNHNKTRAQVSSHAASTTR